MNALVSRAFQAVEIAFSYRPHPYSITHCTMCYTEEKIARLLSVPYSRLIPEDLDHILWDAFICWGIWPEVAYYVPRLPEFYAADALPYVERLYAKLLLAVRPELGMPVGEPNIIEKMTAAERSSVFHNEKALDSFFSLSHVASYLARHVGEVAYFGKAQETDANFVLEWALAQQAENASRVSVNSDKVTFAVDAVRHGAKRFPPTSLRKGAL